MIPGKFRKPIVRIIKESYPGMKAYARDARDSALPPEVWWEMQNPSKSSLNELFYEMFLFFYNNEDDGVDKDLLMKWVTIAYKILLRFDLVKNCRIKHVHVVKEIKTNLNDEKTLN